MVLVQTRTVADKASLSGLRRAIRGDLSRAGVEPAAVFDCLVAVTEAWNHVLEDAASDHAAPALAWSVESGSVRFQVQESCTRASARASHPSGRGRPAGPLQTVADDLPLALMRTVMDEVDVEDGPAGRMISLTKHL